MNNKNQLKFALVLLTLCPVYFVTSPYRKRITKPICCAIVVENIGEFVLSPITRVQ